MGSDRSKCKTIEVFRLVFIIGKVADKHPKNKKIGGIK